MSRNKRAKGQRWNVVNKARAKDVKETEQEQAISKEEHQERIRRLKEAGLLK